MARLLKKYLLIMAGFISLSLGLVGIVMPLLPTTPFFLLAAFCFIRSSTRLYQVLIHNKVFGNYISNYLKYQAVTRKTKVVALLWLWFSLGASFFFVSSVYISAGLLTVGLAVSVHIFFLRTIDPGREQL